MPHPPRRPRIFTTRARVRYAETDATGIVYYANYFIYFELGRIEMFRALGLPYDRRLPIVETTCRYRASARFDDLLEIRSTVGERRSKGFRIDHQVFRVDEETDARTLLVEGSTAMVTTDEAGRPIPLPLEFREALAATERA